MKRILTGVIILFSYGAFANPVELTPRASSGDMQFGFSCDYTTKKDMEWSVITVVNDALPTQSVISIFNKKSGAYMIPWENVATKNNILYIKKTNFQEVSALLLNLQDSEIHLKLSLTNKDISFFLPLGDYRIKFPNYFIDNVNQNKGCLIKKADLPLN